jgi:3-oxoacyl-[acyl-carrier protein] reductase
MSGHPTVPPERQTAIVTGGVRGIGLAIARRLASDGRRVVLWDVAPDAFDAAAAGFAPLLCLKTDVADPASVDAAFAATLAAAGSVEILVNNAGISGPVRSTWEYALADWRRVLAVDLDGVFHCCRAVAPHMRARGYGRIVNVASIAGKEGVPGIAPYSAAKAGVIALTKSLAKELARDGVTANCIAPAMVETELLQEMTQAHIDATRAKAPMGRLLQLDEVAAMVAWIAGPECSYTSGFAFDLTGGRATY